VSVSSGVGLEDSVSRFSYDRNMIGLAAAYASAIQTQSPPYVCCFCSSQVGSQISHPQHHRHLPGPFSSAGKQ